MQMLRSTQLPFTAILLASLAGASRVPPGVATDVAAEKLKTLGTKFETKLEECEVAFAASSEEYATKICKGMGCEPDDKKRALNQIAWDGVVLSYKKEKSQLIKMLGMCWKAKNSHPLRAMFAEWIAGKKLEAKAAKSWTVVSELRCENYEMGFEEAGGGKCPKPGGDGLALPTPAEQPSGCMPMPTKNGAESDEEAAADAPYKFHCNRQCECQAICDLGSGCSHIAWNGAELSDKTKDNCIIYAGSCTPGGEADWVTFAVA